MVDQVIKLKRNTTNTNAPGTSDIAVGELAIGAVAGKLYIRKSDDSIVEFTDASAGGSTAADDITAGDAAVTIATTSGNITIDAQSNDSDIIFKGTDGGSDTTFLTLDGSAAGAATFNDKIVATELDISGNVDIDGTLEADAVTVDGTALSEVIQDTVGAMFSSNTETGISAAYQDSDGTIDLVVATLNQDTTGNAATATALETARTIHGVSFDGTGNIDLSEVIQDTVGAMFSSNTETGITVTYQDSDGTIDLAVSGGGGVDGISSSADATAITISSSEVVTFSKPTTSDGHTSSVPTIFEANANGDTVPVQLKVKANNGTTSTQGLYGNAGSASTDNTIVLGNSGTSGVAVDSSGRALIGTQTSPNNDSDNAHYAKLIAMGNTNSASGDGRLTLARGEASASLSSGDVLGMIAFADNTFHDFALIKGVTDAATGNDDNAGALVFETVPDGSSANAERMRITNAGNVGIGTNSPARQFHVKSAGTNIGSFEGGNGEGLVIVNNTDGRADIIGYSDTASAYNTLSLRASANDAFNINTSGQILTPQQPKFGVARNAGYLSDDQVWVCDSVDTNIGSHYDSSNGKFTAPVAGVYFFTGSVMTHDSSSNVTQVSWSFRKNNSSVKDFIQHKINAVHCRVDGSIIMTLAANDFVTLFVNDSNTSSGWAGSQHVQNHFGGFLIG